MGEDPASSIIGHLVAIVLLTLANAFFSASEMAMTSTDKGRFQELAEEGDIAAEKVLRILSEPSRYVAIIQLGITMSGFFNAALAARGLSAPFGTWLARVFSLPHAHNIAFFIIVLLLCLFTVIFGEHLPKCLVVQNTERFARRYSGFLRGLGIIALPLVQFTEGFTNVILRFLGTDMKHLEAKVTREKIRSLVEVGQEQGVLGPTEREMIDSVIEFDDKQAEEIMTARTEVFMIDVDDPPEAYTREMLTLKYSRIPVYEDNPDNILGILYIKDYLLHAYRHGFKNVNIRGILRPAYFVPERKNVNDLFAELQDARRHMALLIDEYGGFSGIVTMEDLIEEIMGNIDDEYDHDAPEIDEISPGVYRVHGTISIKEFNSETGAEIDEDSEDFDTIGGFIIKQLDYIPDDGEQPTVFFENLEFRVLRIAEKRIRDIRLIVHDMPEAEVESE